MSETLARQVGRKLVRVPFKSNPQAMTEVISGRVQIMFTDIAAAQAQVKSGLLRPIAVTSKQRSALIPDLPTSRPPDRPRQRYRGLRPLGMDSERYFREAKHAMVGGGTSEIQRSIIAKEMEL